MFFYARPLLLFAILIAAAIASFAQDSIYTTTGRVIAANVKTASAFRVRYYHIGDKDSMLCKIPAEYVEWVVYKDGRRWTPRPVHVQMRRDRKAQELLLQESAPPLICNNTITANIPIYMRIGGYPGFVMGLEYERFVNKRGTLSASMAIYRYWAGTFAQGELRNNEVRANIQGVFFAPGIMYHPFGNNEGTSLSVGAVFPLGSLRRYDTRGTNGYSIYGEQTNHTLAAALLQLNLRGHSRHSIFVTSVSAGPMLSAGDTHGALLLLGFKIGRRF